MEPFVLILGVLVIAVVFRLVAGGFDNDRIGEYIRDQGGELIDQHWNPLGRGWFGEKNDRIYEVEYRDRMGNLHEATVKTSMFSGVYFTEDRIVEAAKSDESKDRELEFENEQLRRRIAELERDRK